MCYQFNESEKPRCLEITLLLCQSKRYLESVIITTRYHTCYTTTTFNVINMLSFGSVIFVEQMCYHFDSKPDATITLDLHVILFVNNVNTVECE